MLVKCVKRDDDDEIQEVYRVQVGRPIRALASVCPAIVLPCTADEC